MDSQTQHAAVPPHRGAVAVASKRGVADAASNYDQGVN